MIFWIDEVVTKTDLVTYNDGLNFGRFDISGLLIHNYKLQIDKNEFIMEVQDDFWECLCEMREDDKAAGDNSPFKRSGYKPLSQMFEHPHELAECIDIWFDRYILDKFIGLKDTFDYVINSVDEIKVTETKVLLSGKCFERRVVKQDIASDGLSSLDDIIIPEVNLVWPESWWFLENETNEAKLRISIQQELNSEIGPKHPLWGYKPVVFAKSEQSDDVLVYLNDGRFAVVHLVWHGHIDQVPDKFPKTVFFEDKNELQRFLNEEM